MGIDSQLSLLSESILAFSTDLKRIQTPHSLFWGFGADKTSTTHWSGCRVQVWVQIWAPACHLAIIPEGYSRRQSKVLTAKSMAKLLGPCSCTAWAGWTHEHKHRVFPSRWQLLRAATGLRKTCYHSWGTDLVQQLNRFQCFVHVSLWQVTIF